jgi:anion-transporting  ArsA/GET3 family ATPase
MDEKPTTLQPPQAPDSTDATALLTLDSVIKERIERIERLKNEMKPQKEMVDLILENDEVFTQKFNDSKKASKELLTVKKELLARPEAKVASEKLKTMKEEMKELQEALSDYLREYQRMTGANEFEGADGELRSIVSSVKLVRKTSLNS